MTDVEMASFPTRLSDVFLACSLLKVCEYGDAKLYYWNEESVGIAMSKQGIDEELSALEVFSDHQITQRSLGLDIEAIAENNPENLATSFVENNDRLVNDAVLECQDNLDFLREQPDEKFKLIVTSPPYNIGKSYEVQSTLEQYLAEQKEALRECVRVLHPQGSICWQVGNYIDKGEIVPLDSLLFPLFRGLGLKLRNRIIWHFGHGLHCRNRLSGRYETINWWTKGNDYTWHLDPIRVPSKYPGKRHFKGPRKGELSGNPKGKNPSDVWVFPNVKSNHPEKTIHPCQFPVELVERLVLSMTDENDDIFDPYVGVGSTVIAAVKHGRNGYGCDVVEEYIDIARERVNAFYAGRLKTRPMGKPVYDPMLPRGGH